jgi:hypothetical protein
VVAKAKIAETMKDAVKVRITTFEGFRYDLQVNKKNVDGADKYYLTVAVSADIPKERPAVKDEKEEDKKKNDEAFAAEKKTKEEKLANEKKLEGWAYEVTEYTVSSLLKKRSEVLADPAKDEAASAPVQTPPSLPFSLPTAPQPAAPAVELKPAPAGGSDALTKPVAPLPEAPKVELKPAPAPDANPVAGEKK